MTTIQQMHPKYLVGFQSDKATAANAALWAGEETFQEAREAWTKVREIAADGPIDEVGEQSAALRRHANLIAKAADRFFGLASVSACGLWGLTGEGRIFEVESTNSGSPYLTEVRFVQVATLKGQGYVPTMERRTDEFSVQSVVAFFDSYGDAHNHRIRTRER